ncbi:MAG: choice-of-anchor L domain-containing protein [Deltaproteobacteria bacterium]|nr:choice-of-anchor L domain-containing protein [Deltaproteobacteria bacterium]
MCADPPVKVVPAKHGGYSRASIAAKTVAGAFAKGPSANLFSAGDSDAGEVVAKSSGAGGAGDAPSASPDKSAASAGAAKKAVSQDARPVQRVAQERDRNVRERRDRSARAAEESFPGEPTIRYLSADDSNSAASPAVVRALIRAGKYVPPDVVRTYEFLNWADFDYPASKPDELAVLAELRPAEKPGEYSLQVAVRSEDRPLAKMRPIHATLLLDVSGSMAGRPWELAQQFVLEFAQRLRPGDRLSLVTTSRTSTALLQGHLVGAQTATLVRELLQACTPSDITNLDKGLAQAYALADQNFDAGAINRVILVSDGATNAGRLSKTLIAARAKDADRQGIYLAGVGVGAGFDDSLMNAVTDAGRGAYLFVDSEKEIARALDPRRFVGTFDVAARDVRLKLVLPPHWKVREFHGEQMSAVASEVVPQYLGPNDQMLYHLKVATDLPPDQAARSVFDFEATFGVPGGGDRSSSRSTAVADMLASQRGIAKADALVRWAEALKQMRFPLEANRAENLRKLDAAESEIQRVTRQQPDPDLSEVMDLLAVYRGTLRDGEASTRACDRDSRAPSTVLGIDPSLVYATTIRGDNPKRAVAELTQLGSSTRLRPQEGHRFLVISTGPVGNSSPNGSGELSSRMCADPAPKYSGQRRLGGGSGGVYDVHQVVLQLRAPADARSFSFDFNFFSAEYPEYVHQDFNDTFYAILQAASTNGGATTNIAFDPNRRSIEVDNNYFQNKFHPIPNAGTGFGADGSTGWLRTSWPIQPGEEFILTFSVHDEGDAIYDSLVVLDNFAFHTYAAVGSTDPLN